MAQPLEAIAGDSITWLEDAPSGTNIRAKVVFQHVQTGTILIAHGFAEGSQYRYSLGPVDSANALGGTYASSLILENDEDGRKTTIRPALQLQEPLDRPFVESHARKMLRLIQRHLEGRMDDDDGRGLESYTIAGVPINKISHVDALALKKEYAREVASEDSRRRAQLGLGTGRRIQLHFES
jgi:hypothetical protein